MSEDATRRTRAFKQWIAKNVPLAHHQPSTLKALEAAFRAGWFARKPKKNRKAVDSV